jgi:hypothetical protein
MNFDIDLPYIKFHGNDGTRKGYIAFSSLFSAIEAASGLTFNPKIFITYAIEDKVLIT